MSGEGRDADAPKVVPLRYSRFAGFERDLSVLREKRVTVVGVGGLGVVALDLLARLGVGTLSFFDFDVVGEENLNRAVFLPTQIGKTKVAAIEEYLRRVNPDVHLEPFHGDVLDGAGLAEFRKTLPAADALLGCVDNPHARNFLNGEAVRLGKPYIDGGARENGRDGAVVTVIPGVTPCYRCNKPQFSEEKPKRKEPGTGGVCFATSLPTTMGIVAALQVQESVRLLVGLGEPAPLLLYRGLEGTVERIPLARDPSCLTCGGSR